MSAQNHSLRLPAAVLAAALAIAFSAVFFPAIAAEKPPAKPAKSAPATPAPTPAAALAALSPEAREKLTAAPIVFVTRRQYALGHHNSETFFPSEKNEYNNGRYAPGGALKILDFKTGKLTTLIETATGVVRDPEVHFSGKRILFSMRKNAADSYHIYEVNPDGTGLRQLTFAANADDLDPFYLADDHIAFSSTREPKYCGCNRHIMANLYRMEPDGANIHQISKNPLFDGHGTLLPDGRILYDRWEYVDRNYGDAQGLWTCNPDGTKHEIYWGNNTPAPGGVIDARPIPGTSKTACIFTSTHDRPWGALAIIDRRLGLDGTTPVLKIWPAAARSLIWENDHRAPRHQFGTDNMKSLGIKYEDPQPLDARFILCARKIAPNSDRTGLYLIDTETDAETLLHADPKLGSFDPVPLAPRARPAAHPTRRDYTSTTGTFYVLDVYNGTHMRGVNRGDVKYLRIVETPEKRFWTHPGWNAQGSTSPAITWDEFMTKRIIGTVPVNADGSAYFEAPAEKFLYFQLLDKDGLMVQTMRSGTIVQPGEQNGCVGCHDDRLAAAPGTTKLTAAALLKKSPDKPTPWPRMPVQGDTVAIKNTTAAAGAAAGAAAAGGTGVAAESAAAIAAASFSYLEQVQPVWDRYCISCHNPEKPAGKKLNLTGAPGQIFNPSYAELWAKRYIRPVGGGPARFLQAREWGSSQSKIIALLRKKHGGVLLEKDDPLAFRRVATWIDLNAPYYSSYATSYPKNPYGRSPLTGPETAQLEKLVGSVTTRAHGRNGDFFFDDPAQKTAPGTPTSHDASNLHAALALNFVQPEQSLVLAGLKAKDPGKYAKALAIIQRGAERVRANGDNGSGNFEACGLDVWRDGKYLERWQRERANRRAIAEGRKLYDNQPTPE